MLKNASIVERGWEAVAAADWDTLIADYTEDMVFVVPGQNDVHEGTAAFRSILKNLGAALPTGFEIESIQNIGDTGDIVSVIHWKSDKVPDGSQLVVLFKFKGDKVQEERWFVDTEQWKAAF